MGRARPRKWVLWCDIFSTLFGFWAAFLLATSIDVHLTGANVGTLAWIKFSRANMQWGLWLLFVSFAAQLPRMIVNLKDVLSKSESES